LKKETIMSQQPTGSTGRNRRRLVVAGVLVALTVAVGIAARVAAKRGGESPPPTIHLGGGGPVHLSAQLDRSAILQGTDGLVRMELLIRGEDRPRQEPGRVPTDLVVILDRSGSMSGQPIQVAKAAVRELLDQLAPEDRFGLVSYASGASLNASLALATPDARRSWELAIAGIPAAGGTNMASGMDLAHDLLTRSRTAGRAQRVVLLSDGHANEGDHSRSGLARRAGRAVQREYVLSTVGIGQGFDETLMAALADAGTGNFYYLPHLERLAGVFSDEFASARETVARALRVEIRTGDGVRVESAGGYPLERGGDIVRFQPGDLFAAQERRIWVTLRAPSAAPGAVALGEVSVSYGDGTGARHALAPAPLPALACTAREDDYYASFDTEVYKRGYGLEVLGRLKQRIAAKLASGDRAAAISEVEAELDDMKAEQLRAFGYVDADLSEEVAKLQGSLNAPAAARPSVQQQMGKELLEAGRDARRSGAKR
jgi:Ca-activated chloride channel family protein